MEQRFITIIGLLVAISLNGCGKIALSLFQSKPTEFKEDPDSPLLNLEERCGASRADLMNPNYVMLSADFKSLPITTLGEKNGIAYAAALRATTHIVARNGLNQADTTVAVESLAGKDAATGTILTNSAVDSVVRPDAENSAKDSTGSIFTSSTNGATVLRLAREDNSIFKGMLCAVGFADSQRDTVGGTTGEIRFDQPTPLSLNPKASAATYELELGAGRSFLSNVRILTAKSTWVQNSGWIPVQVNWKKVSADLTQSSQVTGLDLPTIKADVAYEVSITVTGTQPYMVGLSKRRVYYVDTSTKQFAAILDDSGKIQSGTTDKVLPPVILLPQ